MSLFHRRLAGAPIAWGRWDADGRATTRGPANPPTGQPANPPAADRPLLIFCGTGLDHWTALLAGELHQDADVCALVRDCYTPLAVDVDAQRALAARVQRCLAATADAAGWPALALALPDGRLFGASPWRPVRDRGGRAGLARLLVAVAERWLEARGDCVADAERLAALEATHLAERAAPDPRPLDPALTLDRAEAAAMALADTVNGGFGPPPRAIDAGLLRFLVARCALPTAPPALTAQVERTLLALIAGGVHDHLAGGFHRGAADAGWTLPFFEKRLIDQARLATVLIEAAAVFARPLYREVAERALAWTVAALRRDDGLYAAGVHADSVEPGGALIEGGAYTWTADELAAVLGRDGAALVAQRFGVGDPAHVVAGTGRSVLAVRGEVDADGLRALPALMRRLAVARAERVAPERDETVRTDHEETLLAALDLAAGLPEPEAALVQARDDLLARITAAGRSAGGRFANDPAGRHRDAADLGMEICIEILDPEILAHSAAGVRAAIIADLLGESQQDWSFAERALTALRRRPPHREAALFADRVIAASSTLLRRAPLACPGLCLVLHERRANVLTP